MQNGERLVGRFLVTPRIVEREDGISTEPRYSLVTAETPRFVEYANGGGRRITSREAIERLIESGKVVVR